MFELTILFMKTTDTGDARRMVVQYSKSDDNDKKWGFKPRYTSFQCLILQSNFFHGALTALIAQYITKTRWFRESMIAHFLCECLLNCQPMLNMQVGSDFRP